ncbi:elongation factor P 5-aminopentanone reductase [Clostridium tarantellae]|uniref:Glucose 1-dehydrogenase n=1 Tax=Clostridium tarantellae TaxID=39493 RepID=A0A6I1MHU2_9CLOT|nr:SDR family oxidoreductase [Clostridium tarantellae]MPQ42975.1 glucose 1-dehydrogenase [Clostridium tarantellae]
MNSKLAGQIAYVTGASNGIGKGIALELFKAGATVIVGFNKDEDSALKLVKYIKAEGGNALALGGNLSNDKDIIKIVESIMKSFGKLDILVNNAGISNIGLFMDLNFNDIEEIINTNLIGPMKLTNKLIPLLLKGKNQSIVNISSIWGNVGASCEVTYSTTKGGINLFTKSLAKEVAPWGIRVNCVAPGVINTSMNEWMEQEEKNALNNEIPMSRFGEIYEIGKTVLFLCSKDSSYITGQIITVDGGML